MAFVLPAFAEVIKDHESAAKEIRAEPGELVRVRPGMPVAWTPALADALPVVRAWVQPGDTVVTLGAGDVEQLAPALLEALG